MPDDAPSPRLIFDVPAEQWPMRRYNSLELETATYAPPAWVVEDVIPDGLTMVAGRPKLGKSWLVLDIAIAVARGGRVLDRDCQEGDVLYCALEDNDRRLQDRMRRLTAGGPWPRRLHIATAMSPLDEDGLLQLEQWIEEVERPRLIVIDVFKKVRRPAMRGENPYDADYQAVAPLKALADETGVAIVVVHHQRKQAADEDPLDTVSGSTGLTGAMDTIVVLDRKAEGVTLYARGRDIEEVEWSVQFDRAECRWKRLGDAAAVRMSAERRAVVEALAAEGEALAPTAVAGLVGITVANARKLLPRMAQTGEITRMGYGKYGLPDGGGVLLVPPVPLGGFSEGDEAEEE